MALTFVEAQEVEGSLQVTIEGDTADEVDSPAAKKLALASSGLQRAGCGNQSGRYPVDAQGNPLSATKAIPPGTQFKYRQDFQVTSAIP